MIKNRGGSKGVSGSCLVSCPCQDQSSCQEPNVATIGRSARGSSENGPDAYRCGPSVSSRDCSGLGRRRAPFRFRRRIRRGDTRHIPGKEIAEQPGGLADSHGLGVHRDADPSPDRLANGVGLRLRVDQRRTMRPSCERRWTSPLPTSGLPCSRAQRTAGRIEIHQAGVERVYFDRRRTSRRCVSMTRPRAVDAGRRGAAPRQARWCDDAAAPVRRKSLTCSAAGGKLSISTCLRTDGPFDAGNQHDAAVARDSRQLGQRQLAIVYR